MADQATRTREEKQVERGRFVWHELYTPNPAGAHEFYAKAVGWKSEAWEQDPDYVMFQAPSGPIGAPVTREISR